MIFYSLSRLSQGTLPFGLFFSFCLFFSNCGLFHRGVPKAGEFCDVMAKPPVCLEVYFEERILLLEGKEFPLKLRTRTEYLFEKEGRAGEVWVMTENRVEIRFPNEPARFYLRKKGKFTKLAPSKE